VAKRIGKAAGPKRVEATRHAGDERVNIPTAELESFAEAEEKQPTTLLYPRDPSLDPQLVWKGKDQQDREDLAVLSVPIYIQEHIAPKAIIDDLLAVSAAGRDAQLDLFGDFNGMAFDHRVDFYQHPMKWSNRMILGDSLQVMASLTDKEGLRGQVQMIYIDPPYGIKFGSNWQVSTRKRDVKDGKLEDATRQPEQIRAFRDTWELGIHSYLSYLRDRFVVARDLLTESGSIVVQIGDDNVQLVRLMLDEVFGSENFVSQVSYSKTSGATAELLPGTLDYLLWYARDRQRVKFRRLFSQKEFGGSGAGKYDQIELQSGERRAMTPAEKVGAIPPGARPYRLDNLLSQSIGREKGEGAASWFPVAIDGREFRPNIRSRWKTNEAGMSRLIAAGRVQVTSNTIAYVRFLDDFPAYPISNAWMDIGGIQSRADPKVYVVQTATTAVERCLLMGTDPGDLVLDPTCGSGTTAYVAERWGRRWITIDTSRVALALARTRLMSARYPYYILADSREGLRMEAEVSGRLAPSTKTVGDIRKGFVYERVPHVTLKSIAQNPDIGGGMAREDIEAAIARTANTEVLYDRPFSDPKIARVAGPFTVESLSPHRVVADEQDDALASVLAPVEESAWFVQTILENIRKAGVQNRVRQERLTFNTLDHWPGTFIHGAGEFEENGRSKRVAVAIGPQYGTVGPELVREAAKEASKFFDLLVVCGFAFDARAGDETRQLGRLTILQANMNPDLAMGGDLLKKTGSGNLFTVFGEPDIEIRSAGEADGDRFVVEIRGLDVYDPTTGAIRSDSTDDIACWFLDTAYSEEAFFVRHAYFAGGDRPYENLARTLRAEIDEAAWESLYSTVSRPFERPSTGKIAVKVIDHYGYEILKVYSV
jgi:adenine-specific DNA-methyltransferase